MEEERLYKIALSLIPGFGAHTFKQLINYCGSAKQVFHEGAGKLQRIPGIGAENLKKIKQKVALEEAEKVISDCEKQNIIITYFDDAAYPKRLKGVHGAPAIIYTKGQMDLNAQKMISIVGTRKATHYGLDITKQIVDELLPFEATIISGLAYGIDICAHKEATKCNLPTIGILAGGLDKIYPAAHRTHALKMQENGGILSEHVPGTTPDAPKFPARNRIIAALSDAIIIVEAASRGGALITAEIGNNYNKDVFAVPGNISSTYSEGCNNLIKSHKANLFTSVSDLVYYLNWDLGEEKEKLSKIELPELDGNLLQIIEKMKSTDALLIDELSWQTQIPMSQLAGCLLDLEFKGLIKSLPGKKYALNSIYK